MLQSNTEEIFSLQNFVDWVMSWSALESFRGAQIKYLTLSFISLDYNWGEPLKYPLFLLLQLSIQYFWFDMLQNKTNMREALFPLQKCLKAKYTTMIHVLSISHFFSWMQFCFIHLLNLWIIDLLIKRRARFCI